MLNQTGLRQRCAGRRRRVSATLAIPDRLGNQRIDTFRNILQNPSVGIVFIIPKRREVVRVSGVASLARDPDLLSKLAVNDKEPKM
jgi:uncharacterized protein